MRAMILAAGRGLRMGSLTAKTPKPLLKVQDKYLIEYPLQALVKIGITEIVINVSYHAAQIKQALGDGQQYGCQIQYSEEIEALETGGGIQQALSLLGSDPFIILSGDVISHYPLQHLLKAPLHLAHIVLVPNPEFNATGDFSLKNSWVTLTQPTHFTYANIGILNPAIFAGWQPGKFPLGDVLRKAVTQKKVTGECFTGLWHNLGTPAQLLQLNAALDIR